MLVIRSTSGNRKPSGAKGAGESAPAGADVWPDAATAVETFGFTDGDLAQHALPPSGAVAGV